MKGSVITALMIAGALGASGAAAYLADNYIEKTISTRRAALDTQYRAVRVVVANSDLRPGASLSAQTVAIREIPRLFLHSEAVPAESWSTVAGRVLAHPVKSGEPVLLSHIASDLAAGFSSQLAAGTRALTFPVDDQSSISGMLAPGDHIDIFFTTLSGNESVTLPLLFDVPVIATGMRTATNAAYLDQKRPGAQYSTVTVSVTPDDAARITLAQDAGKITITLRQPNDDRIVRIGRVTKQSLLQPDRIVKAVTRRPRVEIILGGAVQ
jgi:pilus assembly protein CpaB